MEGDVEGGSDQEDECCLGLPGLGSCGKICCLPALKLKINLKRTASSGQFR